MKKLYSLFAAMAAACGVAFADAPAKANWVGNGDRAVITDPLNWQCFDASGNEIANAIPDSSTTTVSITGSTTFNCPEGQSIIWKSLTISGTVTLAADCDWRGVGQVFGGFVSANTTLNLKGYKLYVKLAHGSTNKKITVTDDSAAGSGGEFHMDVPANATFTNSGGWNSSNSFWFTGSVEVVKDGEGTYCPSYPNGGTGIKYYAHTGGTTINGGLLYLGNGGEGDKNETYYAMGRRPVFGQYGSAITINAGGTFDYKGIYELYKYKIYMNGGTFTNTRKPREPSWGSNSEIVFGADSVIDVARTAHMSGPFFLNGHTLTATIAAGQVWYCRSGSAIDGTVKLTGEGTFTTQDAITASTNATYDVACAMNLVKPMSVSNYVARYEGTSNAGSATLAVYGIFTPVTTNFYPATMQNGSTIDLSDTAGAFNITGTFGDLKFASGAPVVTLDVGARSLSHGEKVLSWSAIPENVATFRVTGSAIADTESARVEADGVYYDVPDADVVAVAHWVGAGTHNDFSDPANWVCTNMVGQLAAGKLPSERTAVFFDTLNFDIATQEAVDALSSYQSVAIGESATFAADCDWSMVSVNDSLLEGKTINLSGHQLRVLAPNGTSEKAFTVTDSAEVGGRIVFYVPADATFENTAITIAGTTTFVKDGLGAFIPHLYGLTYTGKNEVLAGTLKLYNDDVAESYTYAFNHVSPPLGVYYVDDAIRVAAGAFYDINGVYDTHRYPVTLCGGTIYSSKMQTRNDWAGVAAITLESDSTIYVTNSIVAWSPASLLNGHTLHIDFPIRRNFYNRGMVVSNGTVKVTGPGMFDVNGSALKGRTATLDTETLVLLNNNVNISNYVARYTGSEFSPTDYKIHVYGSLKPTVDRFHNTVLHEGATIDLSALSGAMAVSTPIGSLAYDSATSNITINVGARTLQAEEQLIAWDAVPEGVTFTLVGDNVQEGDTLCVIESGVFYNMPEDSKIVTKATWNGSAADDDMSNSANWTCLNAYDHSVEDGVPGANTIVKIVGSFGASVPAGAELSWHSVSFGTTTLTADVDLRGIDSFFTIVDADSTIDLHGHRLYVNAEAGSPSTAFTVTDTTTDASAPGELHVSVTNNATFTNNRVALSGNLKFVKEGDGVFIPNVYNQTYTGGSVVADGTVKIYNDTTADSIGYSIMTSRKPYPLGVYTVPILVDEGGELDINGIYDSNLHPINLNGGKLANSKAQTQTGWGSMGNVSLSSNSYFSAKATTVVSYPFDLGGNKLTCDIGTGLRLYICCSAISNGTVEVTSGGWWNVGRACNASDVDFTFHCALSLGAEFSVHDYSQDYNADYNAGTAALKVYGTFTPPTRHNYYYAPTMQDGSTIDLSARTDVWSASSSYSAGSTNVLFASNAKVNIKLDPNREYTFDENYLAQVVSWNVEPPENTTFKLVGQDSGRRREIVRREDGLYIRRPIFIVIIR